MLMGRNDGGDMEKKVVIGQTCLFIGMKELVQERDARW